MMYNPQAPTHPSPLTTKSGYPLGLEDECPVRRKEWLLSCNDGYSTLIIRAPTPALFQTECPHLAPAAV